MTSRRFPFGLPDGWFPAPSDEFALGAVLRARYFGVTDLRTEGGAVVLDALPHLGAHLGVGGKVVGETIQCPFHGWQYGADGACVKIPYAAQTPSGVRARSWPVVERNGAVLVWHDAEGRAPRFEIPAFPEWQARLTAS
jgi:phenylpropionate dioxygenase-like ring-hydroxylating dioxygenase large terminal subunit